MIACLSWLVKKSDISSIDWKLGAWKKKFELFVQAVRLKKSTKTSLIVNSFIPPPKSSLRGLGICILSNPRRYPE